jgi:hypothetical protein
MKINAIKHLISKMQSIAQEVPYKMQNPEVKSPRNHDFVGAISYMKALHNAKPRSFFSMIKCFGYKMQGPGSTWSTFVRSGAVLHLYNLG